MMCCAGRFFLLSILPGAFPADGWKEEANIKATNVDISSLTMRTT